MKEEQYYIPSNFTIRGAWGLSWEEVRNGNRYYGELSHKINQNHLFLYDFSLGLFSERDVPKDVYGLSLKGNWIHLRTLWPKSGSHTMNPQATIGYQNMGVGEFSISNFIPTELTKYDYLNIKVKRFDEWILNKFKPRYERKDNRLIYSYSLDESYDWGWISFQGRLFKINLIGNIASNTLDTADRKLQIFSYPLIKIIGEATLDEMDGIKISREIEKFFSIIFGFSALIDKVGLYIKDDNRFSTEYPNSLYPVDKEKLNLKGNYIFEFSDVENSLPILLKSWFIRSENLRLLSDNYLRSINFNMTEYENLITLTEGIENYFPVEGMSLKQKINAIIYELPRFVSKFIEEKYGTLNNWINSIVDTRVYLTHGTKRKRRILNFEELIIKTETLQFIVQLYILKNLGLVFSTAVKSKVLKELDNLCNMDFY